MSDGAAIRHRLTEHERTTGPENQLLFFKDAKKASQRANASFGAGRISLWIWGPLSATALLKSYSD
jgi:hypothetical protein